MPCMQHAWNCLFGGRRRGGGGIGKRAGAARSCERGTRPTSPNDENPNSPLMIRYPLLSLLFTWSGTLSLDYLIEYLIRYTPVWLPDQVSIQLFSIQQMRIIHSPSLISLPDQVISCLTTWSGTLLFNYLIRYTPSSSVFGTWSGTGHITWSGTKSFPTSKSFKELTCM